MSYVELSALVSVVCNITLALFVFTRDFHSTLNRVYFLWGVSVATWNLGAFFLFRVESPTEAMFWANVLQIGIIFLPVSNLHICLLVAQISIGRLLPFIYALHVGMVLILFSGYFISGVRDFGYAYYAIAGPGFYFYIFVYTTTTTVALVMLYLRQRQVVKLHKTRLRAMIAAIGILVVFGTNDMMPILGVDNYPFIGKQIYPLGNTSAIAYVILIAYSVLQHQILDIHFTLSRYAAHFVRIFLVLLLGLTLLLIATQLAPDAFTPFSFFSSLGVLLVTTLIASIFLPRLFGMGTETLERTLLGDRFEYHDRLRGFIREVPSFSEREILLGELHLLLVKTVRVERYHLILQDELTPAFALARAYPEGDSPRIPDITLDSPLSEYFQETRAAFLSAKLSYSLPGESLQQAKAIEQLAVLDPEICLPIFAGDEYLGLLLLGSKVNEGLYTPRDIELLSELTRALGGVVNQLRLKRQIAFREEMELIGVISSGLAHDLNNLFTPILTYLQIVSPGADTDADELLPIALKNTRAIRTYLSEALAFSEKLSPRFAPVVLNNVLEETLQLCSSRLELKNISVELKLPENLELEADKILLQRLFANLIYNAMDASETGQQLTIHADYLARYEFHRNWYRIEVVDRGKGISKDLINKVFTPYYTTKNVGETGRGSGLGLAISRKIVHLHQGDIRIRSEPGNGTTLTIDLPSRQFSEAPHPANSSATR